MDRTSIIILAACFLLLFTWPLLVNKIYPPKPPPPGATNLPSATLTTPSPPSATSPTAPPALESATTTKPITSSSAAPEELLELTNSDAHYTFTTHGGGLKLVELLRYPESVSNRRGGQINR